ncbi:MAG: 16S rRNA (cytosine(1402)-N(4))-methyltransferase, partial [Bacteroidia bacterium]|nr:16S rRNA (cytosine(1402)-N(4))-methyltransferase [Bacteroidia bacterium]
LMEYGELPNARRIASEIIQFRKHTKIETVNHLLTAVQEFTPKSHAFKFLSQIFQAIRIEVNDELTALQRFLEQALAILKPEGRLAVICYHSLEDRLVKHYFQTGNFDGFPVKDFYGNIQTPWELPFKKPIEPTTQEVMDNPRARSAKLRVAIKK